MLLKKGDILPALPEEKIKWLLDAGAIHACNPEPLISSDLTEEETKLIADSLDAIKKEDDAENSEQPVQTDAVDKAELMEGEMDIPEVPEIDAMEGIVVEEVKLAEPQKPENPKQKAKTASKKRKEP